MKNDEHADFTPDVYVSENDDENVASGAHEPKDEALGEKHAYAYDTAHDQLDEMTDKLGSYALARERLDQPEPTEDLSAEAQQAHLDAKNAPPKTSVGKSTRRYVSGPQLGEETAPVAEQRTSKEEVARLRANMAQKINPLLKARAIKIVRKKAEERGVDPDLAERAYHQRYDDT